MIVRNGAVELCGRYHRRTATPSVRSSPPRTPRVSSSVHDHLVWIEPMSGMCLGRRKTKRKPKLPANTNQRAETASPMGVMWGSRHTADSLNSALDICALCLPAGGGAGYRAVPRVAELSSLGSTEIQRIAGDVGAAVVQGSVLLRESWPGFSRVAVAAAELPSISTYTRLSAVIRSHRCFATSAVGLHPLCAQGTMRTRRRLQTFGSPNLARLPSQFPDACSLGDRTLDGPGPIGGGTIHSSRTK